jgi:hypothetical protein
MTDYRNAETVEEITILKENFKLATVEERDMFTRYLDQTLPAEEFISNGGFELFVRLGYFIPNVPSINTLIGSYEDFGIKAEPLKGSSWHTPTMIAVNHDGVQYGLDDRGKYFLDNDKHPIEQAINQFQLISTHYHQRVKEVYDYLKTKTPDDIWAMVSGGQVFFGNKDGYIAILYFDSGDYVTLGVQDDKKALKISTKKYTLAVQFSKNNHYFDKHTLKNFKIQKSDCEKNKY